MSQSKLWVPALFLVALLLLPNASAAARTEVRSYEAAAIFVSISGFEDPVGATTDGTVDVGGVAFDTAGGDTTVRITITDAVKAATDPANKNVVPADVCQDLNGDNQCDVSQLFCGETTVSLGSDPLGFQPGFPLVVFVYASEVRVSGLISLKPCPGNTLQRAFTGTITAEFA